MMTAETELKIALMQFAPEWENAHANRQKLTVQLQQLDDDVDLIVLPEAFSTGFSMKATEVSEEMDGETVAWMVKTAAKLGAAICGSLFIKDGQNFFNRFLLVSPEGDISSYDKRHLFSIGGENEQYNKGTRQQIIEYKNWRIFPQVCYDLRFPVWSRNTMAYDVLINVANWPAPRFEVWNTLLKARAIENQCYVVGVNRVGTDGNTISHRGDSQLVDFKGNVIVQLENSERTHIVSLNKEKLHAFRKKFNTLNDRDEFDLLRD